MLLLSLTLAAQNCIDLRNTADEIAIEGRLTVEISPGPSNYESVRHGDRPEHVYVVEMSRETCIDDGGDFADPEERVRHAQVFAVSAPVAKRLAAWRGQWVRIRGRGFAANNARHYAPLIVEVRAVRRGR